MVVMVMSVFAWFCVLEAYSAIDNFSALGFGKR